MTGSIPILSHQETKDILDAAESTLVYVLEKVHRLESDADPSKTVERATALSLQSVRAALSAESSAASVMAHATNATVKLRTALNLLEGATTDGEWAFKASQATARALSLLVQLTLAEDAKTAVPRRNRSQIERQKERKIASRRHRPTLHVSVGANTANFFCDLDMDIASGGLFVSTADLLPVGSKVNLVATLPDQRVLIGGAVVAFVRERSDLAPEIPPGMGLILTGLSRIARVQINEFMVNNQPMLLRLVGGQSGNRP
jgi:Tfp pilus assembly protein PilZ